MDATRLLLLTSAFLPLVAPQSSGIYTIVAPRKLRPNLKYHVSTSLSQSASSPPVDLRVTLSGPSDNGSSNRITKQVQLHDPFGLLREQRWSSQVGDWGPGKYKLSASGSGGLDFFNETELTYEHKSYSVFVQTDKAVYKPGQKVLFRVIVMDPYLLPTVTGAMNVHVTDAKGNRIHQWDRVLTQKGIYSSELQLSDQPVLGDWAIHVDILGQKYSKNFTVAEYVLPTFEVRVKLPAYATYNKSEVVATVSATYTYGKPVKGTVTLTVAPRTRYHQLRPRPYEQYQTKAEIDGSVDIPVAVVRDLSLKTDFFRRDIEFFALVEERLTGRKYNSTSYLTLHDKEVKVELVKTSETFKPGLKYTCFLKVAYQDDTPVHDAVNQLTLYQGFNFNEDLWKTSRHWVPANGVVRLELFPPNDNATVVLGLRAEFRGQTHYLEGIYPARSPTRSFLQAWVTTEDPMIGDLVEVEVNSTQPLDHLVYEVMGRGDIVFAQTLPASGVRTYRFSFSTSFRMAPRARVLVYYVRKDGELVADAVNFDLGGILRTPVQVQSNLAETKPGGQVDILVSTRPNAYVGLLGVDQSVLLLKKGNDLSQEQVIEELESFDSGKQARVWPPWYRRRRRSLWWPGSTTAHDLFKDSGMVVLTNGLVYESDDGLFARKQVIRLDTDVLTNPVLPPSDLPEAPPPVPGRIRLRQQYPETWLWSNVTASHDGRVVISSTVPDTITSWVISAFALDSLTGLGIAPSQAKVTVFRPFFVTASLPYSILRGESVAIQCVVFNYNNKPVQARVTLENAKSEFVFTSLSNDVGGEQSKDRRSKEVTVPAQDGVAVSFLITPTKLGYIDIHVSATSSLAGDSILKKLLVKPEGSKQHFNRAVLVDRRNPSAPPTSTNISIPIPKNAVPGSERISVSAVGDLLGPHVNNLDQLLVMPHGCGEQNMLDFVPNVVVLDYLRRANRLSPAVRGKALRNLEDGYQRQLTYKRDDNSFSAFGNTDRSGSTWLTAFVLKSFVQAVPYTSVDPAVLENATRWLVERQKPDGSFEEPGEVIYKPMQSGAGSGAALTAYVLIALLENKVGFQHALRFAASAAEEFLLKELRTQSDPYVVAVVTYALHLSGHRARDGAFQKLLSLATREDDMVFWKDPGVAPVNTTDKQSDFFFKAHFKDVEMTAYALLTLMERGDVSAAIPVMRWLVSKQNSNGGYSSTQDTVIGIQALARLAASVVSQTIAVDASVKYGDGRKRTLKIHSGNALVLQRIELPSDLKYVEIESSGFGVAIIQVSWSFNLAVSSEAPAFFLNPLLDKTSTESYLQLSVCTHYRGEGEASNMAVMEVGLPSGYLFDFDTLSSIHRTKEVRRVESQDSDTNVVIYFDRIGREELCVTVPAHREHKVANQKPVPVKVYDYYDLARSARMFYSPYKTTLCDVCDGVECGNDCNTVKGTKAGTDQLERETEPDAAADTRASLAAVLALSLTAVLFVRWW
ncbi:thioester-containing protein, putative [Ixodes scapularis]|uniref:TEP1-F n=1 Tax=Ixodes scapularis TaxID=6945 RepID=B7Q1E2_IXOSC|nr:thioester-containing protein, putative [Ixodes scapularis]|eukprot:XP_002409560.1 thioester-containing protein, putative [Ixodes scapularis]